MFGNSGRVVFYVFVFIFFVCDWVCSLDLNNYDQNLDRNIEVKFKGDEKFQLLKRKSIYQQMLLQG